MNNHVNSKCSLWHKCLPTHRTHKWTFPSMNPPVNQHFTFDENLSTEFTFVWNLFLFGAAFCTPRGYVSRSGKKRDGNINSSSFQYVRSNLSLGSNWAYNSYPSTMYSNCPKEIPGLSIKSCFICSANSRY